MPLLDSDSTEVTGNEGRGTCKITSNQWDQLPGKVTDYIYSSTVFQYNVEVLVPN